MDESEDLRARMAATRERGRRLAAQVSDVAGAVAETEEQIAEQRDRMAGEPQTDGSARAERLRAQAADARSFAEHERSEQRRWRPSDETG
jgi:hypothetical protein